MILPNKTLTLSHSLLGAGALIIPALKYPQTVSSLWEKVKKYEEVKSFSKFVLILDLLYTLELLTVDGDVIFLKKV